MHFNSHSELSGKHAFLSPSSSAWLRYDETQVQARLQSWKAAKRGTDIHNHAHESIRLGIYLAFPTEEEQAQGRGNPIALAAYVAHGIDWGMSCEVPLFYSENCFGHADTMSFDTVTLRISDLKTGITASKMEQLKIYAAIFCLEYGVDPYGINIELRIYQREEIHDYVPSPEEIVQIMTTIVERDQYIESLKVVA